MNKNKNGQRLRGYIAMLSVEPEYRRFGLGRELVKRSIDIMIEKDVDEVMLETEITNIAALKLYESFGFIRDKRQLSYYLNGVDAFKLKLLLKAHQKWFPDIIPDVIPENEWGRKL